MTRIKIRDILTFVGVALVGILVVGSILLTATLQYRSFAQTKENAADIALLQRKDTEITALLKQRQDAVASLKAAAARDDETAAELKAYSQTLLGQIEAICVGSHSACPPLPATPSSAPAASTSSSTPTTSTTAPSSYVGPSSSIRGSTSGGVSGTGATGGTTAPVAAPTVVSTTKSSPGHSSASAGHSTGANAHSPGSTHK